MEEKKKSSNGLKITIVILIILLITAIGYICYDKGLFDNLIKKKEIKEVKEETKLSEEEVKELHDSLMINDADLYFNGNVNTDSITAEKILPYVLTKYVKDNKISENSYEHMHDCNIDAIVNGSDASDYNDNKIHLCKYDEEKEETVAISKEEAVSIPKTEIDKMIKEIFNLNKSFELNDHTSYTGQQYTSYFIYSKEDNRFYIVTPMAGGDLGIYNGQARMLKYEQSDGILSIYDKVVRCMSGTCYKSLEKDIDPKMDIVLVESNSQKYGKEYTYDNKIVDHSKKDYSIDFDYVFDNYSNLFNTYKTVFKKADDGKYYWYSSEPINE